MRVTAVCFMLHIKRRKQLGKIQNALCVFFLFGILISFEKILIILSHQGSANVYRSSESRLYTHRKYILKDMFKIPFFSQSIQIYGKGEQL